MGRGGQLRLVGQSGVAKCGLGLGLRGRGGVSRGRGGAGQR